MDALLLIIVSIPVLAVLLTAMSPIFAAAAFENVGGWPFTVWLLSTSIPAALLFEWWVAPLLALVGAS